MDLFRQQLEFEVQQLRSVMEERFGTSDEMVQRTQVNKNLKIYFINSQGGNWELLKCFSVYDKLSHKKFHCSPVVELEKKNITCIRGILQCIEVQS